MFSFRPKLIVRVDDVHERMNYTNFIHFIQEMNKKSHTALLGVVPDCQDPKLLVDEPYPDFWKLISDLKISGWEVAQHGYQHLYTEKNVNTILRGRDDSEFAGLSYSDQFQKISNGKAILENKGIEVDVFMAPGHAYDETTLKALKDSGFNFLTDGFGIFPYKRHLICVPQLLSKPHGFYFGCYTTCVHLDKMTIVDINKFINSLDDYDVVNFSNIKYFWFLSVLNYLPYFLTRSFITAYRYFKYLKK